MGDLIAWRGEICFSLDCVLLILFWGSFLMVTYYLLFEAGSYWSRWDTSQIRITYSSRVFVIAAFSAALLGYWQEALLLPSYPPQVISIPHPHASTIQIQISTASNVSLSNSSPPFPLSGRTFCWIFLTLLKTSFRSPLTSHPHSRSSTVWTSHTLPLRQLMHKRAVLRPSCVSIIGYHFFETEMFPR